MITRRTVCGAVTAGSLATTPLARAASRSASVEQRLAALETRFGGRLGVVVHDAGSGRTMSLRGDERVPMCSMIKYPTAALVMNHVDQREERLDRRISYAAADLVTYSPITERKLGTGTSVGDLCGAAITLSDNTAQNLLLDTFGGPAALTVYLRSLGDQVTRSDRRETELNDVAPSDPRDTTSPLAMLHVMQRTLVGDALLPTSREQLACSDGKQPLPATEPSR